MCIYAIVKIRCPAGTFSVMLTMVYLHAARRVRIYICIMVNLYSSILLLVYREVTEI